MSTAPTRGSLLSQQHNQSFKHWNPHSDPSKKTHTTHKAFSSPPSRQPHRNILCFSPPRIIVILHQGGAISFDCCGCCALWTKGRGRFLETRYFPLFFSSYFERGLEVVCYLFKRSSMQISKIPIWLVTSQQTMVWQAYIFSPATWIYSRSGLSYSIHQIYYWHIFGSTSICIWHITSWPKLDRIQFSQRSFELSLLH